MDYLCPTSAWQGSYPRMLYVCVFPESISGTNYFVSEDPNHKHHSA